MPPSGVADCTPGMTANSGHSASRPAFSRPTSCGTKVSAIASAASPPRCTNTGAQELLNSTSLPTASRCPAGSTSQPRRQPVIKKLLEKLCTTTRRSSGAAMSRKLGAARCGRPTASSPNQTRS